MNLQEAVELVFINVNGGDISDQATVQRPEIEVFMPTALSRALQDSIYTAQAQARRSGTTFSLPDNLYVDESVTLAKNGATYVGTLSVPVLSITSGMQVHSVYDDSNKEYMVVPGPVSAVDTPVRTVWFKDTDDATQVLSFTACSVTVKYIPMWICYDDGNIRAPQDVVERAIEIATAFFRNQKGIEGDPINDAN